MNLDTTHPIQHGILVFEYGVEGGGGSVYQFADGSIVETGSSGGFLDEDEDPIINWEKKYKNWDSWWMEFIRQFQNEWVRVYPKYINDSLKGFFIQEINKYPSGELNIAHSINRWLRILK